MDAPTHEPTATTREPAAALVRVDSFGAAADSRAVDVEGEGATVPPYPRCRRSEHRPITRQHPYADLANDRVPVAVVVENGMAAVVGWVAVVA